MQKDILMRLNRGVLSQSSELKTALLEKLTQKEGLKVNPKDSKEVWDIYKDTAGIWTLGYGLALKDNMGKLLGLNEINSLLIKVGGRSVTQEQYMDMLNHKIDHLVLGLSKQQFSQLLDNAIYPRLLEMETAATNSGIELGKLPVPAQVALADMYYNGGGGLILGSGSPNATGALRDGDWGKLMFEFTYNSNGGVNPVWGVDQRHYEDALDIYRSLPFDQQVAAKARFEQLRALPGNKAMVERVEGRRKMEQEIDDMRVRKNPHYVRRNIPDLKIPEPGATVHVSAYVRKGPVFVSDYERGYPHKLS